MNNYTCIIVDDEPLARQLLLSYIEKISYLEVTAVCQNAIEAKLALQQKHPDILFIDIMMPNLSGIDFLKMLQKKPATVLTTAHAEYAIEGYTLDVIDYLLKPIEFDRFFKATNKCMEWLSFTNHKAIPYSQVTKNSQDNIAPKENYFFVKSDFKIVKVLYDDVLYIEALQKYVRIHTYKERIITLTSMSQLSNTLPQQTFCRIHRSHIINLDKIESIEGNTVHINKFSLPISKSLKEEFLNIIKSKIK